MTIRLRSDAFKMCSSRDRTYCNIPVVVDEALTVHRLHFAFTITYHYLFPQLTMGLALLVAIMKTIALVTDR